MIVELAKNAWPYIETFLKIAPGLILLPFSVSLALKKLSHKVEVCYVVNWSIDSGHRISEILINNLKDKPLPVFAITFVLNRDQSIVIKKFDTPVIIKGLESFIYTTEEVTDYYINGEAVSMSFSNFRNIEIYVTTTSKIVKCKAVAWPKNLTDDFNRQYHTIIAERRTFKGKSVSPNFKYAFEYNFEGRNYSGFVMNSGLIRGDWPYASNIISAEDGESQASVRNILQEIATLSGDTIEIDVTLLTDDNTRTHIVS